MLQDASRMKVRKDGQAGDAQIADCEASNPVETCFFLLLWLVSLGGSTPQNDGEQIGKSH